jgi:hypothetical protein
MMMMMDNFMSMLAVVLPRFTANNALTSVEQMGLHGTDC